jgi:hypothetical protein
MCATFGETRILSGGGNFHRRVVIYVDGILKAGYFVICVFLSPADYLSGTIRAQVFSGEHFKIIVMAGIKEIVIKALP